MQEQVKVSVICITYNHEPYIRKALESFVMQKTNFKFEVLVHDDASTDGTANIIREYEKKYPDLIKPIYQTENQYSKGIGILKTFIYPCVKGEYVAFCEGDDFWTDENKLQMQVDFLDKHQEYSACTHAYQKLNMKKNDSVDVHSFMHSCTVTPKQIIRGDGGLFSTNSVVCRAKPCINMVPFRENSPVGDYPLMIHLSFEGKVYYIDKVMSCYRFMVPGSWTQRNMCDDAKLKKHTIEMQNMLEEADRYAEYKYTEIFRYVILSKWYYYYYRTNKMKFKISYFFKIIYLKILLKYKRYFLYY